MNENRREKWITYFVSELWIFIKKQRNRKYLGSYDAFFDGEKYLLRGQNGGEFYFDNPDYDLTTSPFAQSSLFPNIDVTDAHSVMLIPKVKLNENNPINNNPSTSETEDDLENKNRSEDNERNLDNSPEPEEKIIQTGREELDTFDINI